MRDVISPRREWPSLTRRGLRRLRKVPDVFVKAFRTRQKQRDRYAKERHRQKNHPRCTILGILRPYFRQGAVVLLRSTVTRMEKAARDGGFEIELPAEGDWLAFGSSQTPMRLWLRALDDGSLLIAVSHVNVGDEMREHATSRDWTLPHGARALLGAPEFGSLHRLILRAFQLSITLPDELLHLFERQTAHLPRATEVERLVVQRVGQEIFRSGLLNYWDDRCAITGLGVRELLRASHIKPWAACESDAERMSVFNGLLLAPHFDAAFDLGFITVNDDGRVISSAVLPEEARVLLGFDAPLRVRKPLDEHRVYLAWHRERVFRRLPHVAK